MIKTNNCIDKLLNIIKNKKTLIALKNQTIENLKQKLTDKSKKSIKKTKNNKQSINFETNSDVSHTDTKKMTKIIILSDLDKFIKKTNFELMTEP